MPASSSVIEFPQSKNTSENRVALPQTTPSLKAPRSAWTAAFRAVRAETERRAAPLSPEDQVVQSMPDASPVKWHRAHTTWFFEQFLLRPHSRDYQVFDEAFGFLFNSYYVAVGPRHARPERGLITRPNCAQVGDYRRHVDNAVERLIAEVSDHDADRVLRILEIGLHHEQQHQELLLTDVLHAFSQNPLMPVYDSAWKAQFCHTSASPTVIDVPAGGLRIGFQGLGFCFDNEEPAHDSLLQPVKLSRGLVTNGQWFDFIRDGGYSNPSFWLSDGWSARQKDEWVAPGYWQNRDGQWLSFTLAGLKPIDALAPVTHISYYESDAFARWSGQELPTEAEWEIAAEFDLIDDAFGLVWQWTKSPYAPYPGYRPAAGALGEYNGKFMINQMVLRGSSHATPSGHTRTTYRNFFYPNARWQFSGLRLSQTL